jgi:3-oxoacyl-[acyl-carrier-protein] synthase II
MSRRVVVTGVGMVSPLAHTATASFAAMLEGKNAIGPVTQTDTTDLSVTIAAEVKGFEPEPFFPNPKDARRNDPFIWYVMGAADEAMKQAGLDQGGFDPDRAGSIIGVGVGGLQQIDVTKDLLREKGPRRVSPFFVPSLISNMAPGQLSMKYNLRGPNWAPASACASGSHGIGEAFETIRRGRCDVMLTGGSEHAILRLCIAGFANMRALSTRNDDPEHASRPFDKERDGFVMGAGAGVLVLEELEHARKRGATILAEMAGYGSSCDANHLTAPHPEGRGAIQAISGALASAGLAPRDIDYVNAHGTSTPINDPIETKAIKAVFGEHARKLKVSSTKSMHGHLLGGAGGIEAVVTVMAIHDRFYPPTRNLENPDPACDLDYVPNTGTSGHIRAAISNALGFGGHNSVVLFREFTA